MLTHTSNLIITERPLSAKEKGECARIIKFCSKKLFESPKPTTFIGKIFDFFNEESSFRSIRQTNVEHNQRILEANCIWEITVKPVAAIYFEEFEDEGHYYIFDVGSHTLLFFGSQDYPPTKNFPNEHFSISGANKQITNHGKKLSTITTLDKQLAKKIAKPATVITFPGSISTAIEDYETFSKDADWDSIFKDNARFF